jgi:hypothetical protein
VLALGYIVSDGSINIGSGLYSFGSVSASDRALGSVGTNTAVGKNYAYGLLLRNTSGAVITNIRVGWTLEQWREQTTNIQKVSFAYKTSSSIVTSLEPNVFTSWTTVTALDLSSPNNVNVNLALNGNASANRVSATNISLPSLSLANNDYILLKWDDPDQTGTDHHMGIDDITIAWGSTLPIELTTFEGKNNGNQNLLT